MLRSQEWADLAEAAKTSIAEAEGAEKRARRERESERERREEEAGKQRKRVEAHFFLYCMLTNPVGESKFDRTRQVQ